MKKLCCQQSKELLSILQSLSVKQTMKVITADESWFFLWYGSDDFWSFGGKRLENTFHVIGDEIFQKII